MSTKSAHGPRRFFGNLGAVHLLLERQADVARTNDLNRNALTLAAMRGHDDICRVLLAAKAATELRDWTKHTPRDWAKRRGHWALAKLILDTTGQPKSFGQQIAIF